MSFYTDGIANKFSWICGFRYFNLSSNNLTLKNSHIRTDKKFIGSSSRYYFVDYLMVVGTIEE